MTGPGAGPATTSRLRALILISGLPPGGAEEVTVRFARELRRRGRRIPVCTLTARHDGAPAEVLTRSRIPRHDLGARRLLDPGAYFRLVELLRREEIDLIHAHGQDASILAAAAVLLHPAALVITRHVLDEPARGPRERARAVFTRIALRRADAVVAVSRAVARRLVEDHGVPSPRVRTIPNGIEHDRFEEASKDGTRPAVRRALDLAPSDRVVLVPAVLREGKGHEVLLRALPEIRRRIPDLRVLLAGSGEREAALRSAVKEQELDGVVRFLGHRDDVPRLLAACDVVVLPSFAEALPTVLLEAAAAGRPAVATRTGGVPEVVKDGATGILVRPGDPVRLARAIAALLSDPERTRRLGTAARRRSRERFGMARMVRETVELWDAVAGRARKGTA